MNRNNGKPHSISPFLEGVARTFDLAGSFDDSPIPALQNPNPVAEDWRIIGNDYFNSIKIIGEEKNGNKKKPVGK